MTMSEVEHKGPEREMMTPSSAGSLFQVESFVCEDLKKPQGPISTGIGYLDHMIDQFNSHAQIGISLLLLSSSTDNSHGVQEEKIADHDHQQHNRYADMDQGALMSLVGSRLGEAFRLLLEASPNGGASSVFSCPLDEALVECQLGRRRDSHTANKNDPRRNGGAGGSLRTFQLAPYGNYPAGPGRSRVGRMQTAPLSLFWTQVAEHGHLDISLVKIRGRNAHHIIEATFKAFARALRNLLDGTDAVGLNGPADLRLQQLYGPDSVNARESVALDRQGRVTRSTKETSISAHLRLDGGQAGVQVETGLQTLDEFWRTWVREAHWSLQLTCQGDLWIDEHHTAEDVAITMGQVLTQALGTKAGLNRMWCATATYPTATWEVVVDLSNRPGLFHNLVLEHPDAAPAYSHNGGPDPRREDMIGDLSIEMFEHVLESFVMNAHMTVHIRQADAAPGRPPQLTDTVQAVAMAFGRALRYCAMVDSRRAGATASSKGTLSV